MIKKASLTVLVLVVLGLAGCGSSALPPKLTEEQHAAIARTRFKASVGVETYKFPVYSEALIARLRKTQLFERVDALDAFAAPPTFVARVERPVYGTAGIPLWTLITFGVIPTTVQEEHGHVFSLTPTANRARRIAVDFRYKGPSTLGWAALYIALFDSNQTLGDSREHPRFIQSLAWHVLAQEKEIARHAGGGT